MSDKNRPVMSIRSALCDCQAGRYLADIADHNREQPMTISRARALDLVPAHPTGFSEYWLHAKLAEARHDTIRHGENADDWMLRYLEFAATLSGLEAQSTDLFAWVAKNPRPGKFRNIKRTARAIYEEVMP